MAWSNGSVGGTFHMSSFTAAQPAPQRGVLGIKETTYHIQVFKCQSLGDMLFMCYQRKTLHFCVPTKILKMIWRSGKCKVDEQMCNLYMYIVLVTSWEWDYSFPHGGRADNTWSEELCLELFEYPYSKIWICHSIEIVWWQFHHLFNFT